MNIWWDIINYSDISMVNLIMLHVDLSAITFIFSFFKIQLSTTRKPKTAWYSLPVSSVSTQKWYICIEFSSVLVTNMDIYLAQNTITNFTIDVMIWWKPRKFPLTVSTYLTPICDTSISLIFLRFVAVQISSKVFSFFSLLKNYGRRYYSLVDIMQQQFINSLYVLSLVG